MNARDRRLARRREERLALKKGTLTLVTRDVPVGEVLEAAELPETATAEVSEVLSPERAALALVTNALAAEPPETSALEGEPVPVETSFEIVTASEIVPLRLVPEAVEQPIAATVVDGEPVDPDSEVAATIRLNLENFVFNSEGYLLTEATPTGTNTTFEVVIAPDEPEIVPPAASTGGGLRWTASFAPEGFLTDDGRAIAPGALSWRDLPLTLMAMVETTEGGHQGALVAGRIDEIWRDESGMIRGSGIFDDGEFGIDVARMVADQTLRGISIDMAIQAAEVGPRADYFDADGVWTPRDAEAADEEDESTLFDMLFGEEVEEPIFVVLDAVIGAVTVCPFPAFANTTIEMAASLVSAASPAVATVTSQAGLVTIQDRPAAAGPATGDAEDDPALHESLSASAAGLAPVRPPASWFTDPEFTELTALTVTEDGQVFGHAWAWGVCHIGIPGACTTAPRSNTDYALFLLKEVECDDGARIPCGTITLETGHADKRLGRADATRHYDDTGTATVDVVVGEDEFGGWVAGALRPDVDEATARAVRGAVLSGDWRNVDGNLELVALLAVNVPGFPVPRARALVAAGDDGEMEVLALVAAGMVVDEALLSTDDLERIRALGETASGRFAELAARAR